MAISHGFLRITNRNKLRIRNSKKFVIRRRGFSIIEILVYIGILAVLSTVAVSTLLLTHLAIAEIRTTRALNATAAVAMERMIRVIRDSSAVDVTGSTLDTSPGILVLTAPATLPLSHRFSVSGGALVLESAANPPLTLTPPGAIVTGLTFRRIATTTSEAVKIELTIAVSSGRATTTQNFYGTAVLRNSYAP